MLLFKKILKNRFFFSIVLGLLTGALTFWLLNYMEKGRFSLEMRFGIGKFTNPLLECEVGEDTIASKKQDFTPAMKEFVALQNEKHKVKDIAVYFRDMNNGPTVGVNQDAVYAPASLLKVPILVSYLTWSEDELGVLEEKITFTEKKDAAFVQRFAPAISLETGKTYTVRELLERMIKYSDNQALLLLSDRIPLKYQHDLYDLLGVDQKLITESSATISVKQYSIFFRILFNASFLSRKNSEYALELLSQVSFKDGLQYLLPKDLPVSHKFGERQLEDGTQQFHDCGIVYYPQHPYLLCIMTRGGEAQNLVAVIQETSEFVYKKIEKQYPK